MPPERKMMVEKSVAFVAVTTESSRRRVKRKAITTVAKTSKKPSTQRWTTHQRSHIVRVVEERDGDGRDGEEREERAPFVLPSERRRERAPHQKEPEDEADEEQYLPEAAEVNILVPLRAEPEPVLTQKLLDAQPLAAEAPDDDEQHRREERVHAELLILRLVARDGRRDEEPRRQPRGRNPEEADLRVPRSHDRIRQILRQRNSVETVTFDAVMRGHDAEADLHDDERGDDEEEFEGRALRGRDVE